MKLPFRSAGALRFALLLGAAATLGAALLGSRALGASALQNRNFAPQSACSGSTLLFPVTNKQDAEQWRDGYHKTVDAVVEADLSQSDEQLVCIDDPHYQATPALEKLARKMSPWWDKTTPVTEDDLPLVLQTYLQHYECNSQERLFFLSTEVAADLAQQNLPLGGQPGIPVPLLLDRTVREEKMLKDELLLARPALDRTLLYLSGRTRLRPLMQNLQCLARLSLDLRNILGIVAEQSAYLPRIWDARGSLRDL